MYDELVKQLRHPWQYNGLIADLTNSAADAIEELGRAAEVNAKRAMAWAAEAEKLKGEKTMDSNKYYIIRADRAGVFCGHIKERDGNEVTMTDVRRLWYWEGAASLSQLAVDGTRKPGGCKFTITVPEMTILGVIEIIPCSDKAASSILGVKEWRA